MTIPFDTKKVGVLDSSGISICWYPTIPKFSTRSFNEVVGRWSIVQTYLMAPKFLETYQHSSKKGCLRCQEINQAVSMQKAKMTEGPRRVGLSCVK